eukprot:TRINITY_DN51_c3_g3_i1.p1 TRINITY_DN51_c3_g3~~TRINITY_DN51_c3_g3_i1.p1  ORF type:complete len:169 (+),score=22.40 TRINITY_DN51_c3_g3_i1:905-1411(+)
MLSIGTRTANKAVNPSGGSGGFKNQRFLAAAGLPWSFGSRVNMKAGPEADKFGAFLMAKLRDAAIDHADALLAAHWKAPGLQSLQNELRQLSPEQRAVVRRCVIEAVDGGLHDFLFALGEEYDSGGAIAVVVDGQNVAAQSDGLHGEPYTEDGWFGRFSKHGVPPDPA